MKKSVLLRQVIFMLILSMCTLKVLFLPSLLAKDIGRDLYFYIFFMMMLDFVVLIILFFVSYKNPSLNFYDIIVKCFGKVVAKIILACLFVFFVLKCWASFQTNFVYLNDNLYTTLNWVVFSIPILIVALFVARFGITSFARVIEITMPIITVGLLISLVVGLFRADFSNLLPFMEKGIFYNIPTIFRYSFWFGDYLIFAIFMGNTKEEDKPKLKTFLGVFIAIIIICFFIASFYSVYSYNSVCHSNAISDMLQVLPTTSDIGSFDWILVLMWDTTLFLYLSLYIFGGLYCLKFIFGDRFEIVQIIVILSLIFLPNALTNFDILINIDFAKSYLMYFSIVMQYILPLIILLFSFKIKRRKYDKIPLEK